MKRAFCSILAILALLAPRGALAAASLSEPALAQIREYLSFHKDDEWIQTQFRILSELCADEDRKYEEARRIFESARPGLAEPEGTALDAMLKRFAELSENEVFQLQAIVLWQIETHKTFDPNYFHNLVARSARNAFRLERDGRRTRGETVLRAFDTAFAPLKEKVWQLRADKLSADPSFLDPDRLAALQAAPTNAALRSRIRTDPAPFLKVSDLARFQSFFEITLSLYPDDSLGRHGFSDPYEFLQYLLFVETAGERPNAKYQVGPFHISRLTSDLTRPGPELPATLVTDAFFEAAAVVVDPGASPLHYLASHSKRVFQPGELPARTFELYQYLRSSPAVSGKTKAVTQEVYENRLFVLTAMSDQDFFERYRSVRNDSLFFEQAEQKLGLAELKRILAEPYEVPGGGFVLPRYELLGYTRSEFAGETSPRAILSRIPRQVHIDFIRPLILAIYDRLGPAERTAIGARRVREIAEHFGSPVGVVGDPAMFRSFFSLFREDVEVGAASLAETAGIDRMEAYKWLCILLAIETRGNLFAVSPTGALGPLQHTYYFYLKTSPPSIPFDPRKSTVKTGKEFGRYYVRYRARSPAEALDMAAVAYNYGPDALESALQTAEWRANVSDEARRYIRSFRGYLERIAPARTSKEVEDLLTRAKQRSEPA